MDNYVITIARGYGSGGRTVGKMLAEELGIGYYDKELMRMASEDSGINEALFAKADERVRNSLLYKISRKVYTGELIGPDSDDFISNENLFNYQAKIIKELAASESCVIIGRCADYVLKDNPNVIRLFIYAPHEACISRLRPILCKSDKEIDQIITKTDKKRAEYYKYYTGHEWNDARNYDVCINSNQYSFDTIANIVKLYLKETIFNK
ncbi:MAG: AAA family ATPase [Eubacterium sp.]